MEDDMLDLTPDEDDAATAGGGEGDERGSMTIKEAKEFNKKAIDRRLDGLRYTKKRIEESDEDQLVMQKLEGDVMVEVQPDERDEVLEKIESTIERLEDSKNVELG